MAAPCRWCAGHAARAPGAAAPGGCWRRSSGPRLERDRHLVAAMGAHPDLASARHLPPIVEADHLVGPVDPLPAGHVLALIARWRRRVGLHSPRLSPLASESSRRSTRAG